MVVVDSARVDDFVVRPVVVPVVVAPKADPKARSMQTKRTSVRDGLCVRHMVQEAFEKPTATPKQTAFVD